MSARQQLSIKKWGRTITFLDGEAGLQFPADSLNAKLHGLTYKPRDGYNEVAVTPSGPGDTYSLLGLGHIIDEDEAIERPNYFLSVEDRNGTVKAYKVSETSLDRSASPLTSEDLNGGKWLVSQFYKNAYLINPGGSKTVYRHVAGSTTLDVVQDTEYSNPNNPALTVSYERPSSLYHWDSTDSISYSGTNSYNVSGITETYNANGSLKLNGASEDHGGDEGGYLFVETTFTADQDFSGSEYIFVSLTKEAYMNFFMAQSTKPELYDGATSTWHAVTDAKWVLDTTDRSRATWIMYVKGMTFLDTVRGIKMRIGCKPGRGAHAGPAQDFVTIDPIMAGGTYIKAADSTKRIWDSTLATGSTTFGVVYWNGVTGVGEEYSEIAQQTIGADEGYGFHAADYTGPIGSIVKLSCDDPVTPYTQAKFLRLDESDTTAKWRELLIDSSPPMTYSEIRPEYEIPPLTEYSAGTPPPTIPTFSTEGVRFAFPFKQSMVWLTNGGLGNVHISRVGDAEEIYDSEVTYDSDDLTQPAQRTLADNQADQPVWGVQAGTNAFIVGEKAAYALQGDFPVNLSPSRQIPGSRGIVGPYAGCRFRPTGGQDGACYLDPEGNVWLVNSVPEFTNDTRAKPFELSSLVRHKIKQFLFTEQLGEFPTLSIAEAMMEFQEATSSLWVILGKRAAVYRQDDSGSGWEFYEYQLTTPPGMEEISTCRAFSPGSGTPTSVARTGSTHVWGDPAFGAVDDENEASAGAMTYNDKTQLLRSAGIPPTVLLPLSATVDEMHVRMRHRKVGDIDVFHDWTKMTLSGTPTGSNLALNEVVDTSQSVAEYTIISGLPSVADINAGLVGFETGYVAPEGNPEWNDPENYIVSVTPPASSISSGNTLSLDATITVDYIGPGADPPDVDLNISALAQVTSMIHREGITGPHWSYYEGEGTVTDGLGNSQTGSLYSTDTGLIVVSISNSKIQKLTLTAGHGSLTLTSNSSTVNAGGSSGINSEYTVTAAMHLKVPSTVYVDSMEISYCFTVIASSEGSDSGISWQRVCFTPDSKYLAGRSSGQLDSVEYDFRNGSFINGTGRDGGYQMPDWYLTLERMTFEGRTARLNGVQVNTLDPTDAFSVSGRIGNGSFVNATNTGTSTSRWVRFPVSQIGISHQVKIAGDETVDGIDGLAIEYQMTSRSKVN